MSDRLDENWQLWKCVDCDPEYAHDDEDEPQYDVPYVMLLPEGVPFPDFCPRCGNYLSFCEGAKELQITNTPHERWWAEQQKGQK